MQLCITLHKPNLAYDVEFIWKNVVFMLNLIGTCLYLKVYMSYKYVISIIINIIKCPHCALGHL